ncbi:MAG: GNAT family N-acetyltransferase [Clostridia bacterium]|nr:GNAT family N-acetyltransferase [Clostridia bacterium]
MFFHRAKPRLSDGEIDLIPVRTLDADPEMQFGREYTWIIAPHGSRREMGEIALRLGESPCVYCFGHIGYHVDPPYRGHHYALKACRLIEPLIRREGKSSVVITCDPDNTPSRRTCEELGCALERTVRVPAWIRAHWSISEVKCRYIWHLGEPSGEGGDRVGP